jgi:predicted DNA-binding transcriptional regulator AlpA
MESDSLVDADTLARKLGQATSSIYRLAKSGAIPSFKAGPRGRGVRFDLQEVKKALRRPAAESVRKAGTER